MRRGLSCHARRSRFFFLRPHLLTATSLGRSSQSKAAMARFDEWHSLLRCHSHRLRLQGPGFPFAADPPQKPVSRLLRPRLSRLEGGSTMQLGQVPTRPLTSRFCRCPSCSGRWRDTDIELHSMSQAADLRKLALRVLSRYDPCRGLMWSRGNIGAAWLLFCPNAYGPAVDCLALLEGLSRAAEFCDQLIDIWSSAPWNSQVGRTVLLLYALWSCGPRDARDAVYAAAG
jgi:hypothetical protein